VIRTDDVGQLLPSEQSLRTRVGDHLQHGMFVNKVKVVLDLRLHNVVSSPEMLSSVSVFSVALF
jgi:hypothetical protein